MIAVWYINQQGVSMVPISPVNAVKVSKGQACLRFLIVPTKPQTMREMGRLRRGGSRDPGKPGRVLAKTDVSIWSRQNMAK